MEGRLAGIWTKGLQLLWGAGLPESGRRTWPQPYTGKRHLYMTGSVLLLYFSNEQKDEIDVFGERKPGNA